MGIYDSFSYRPFDGGEVKEYATEQEYYEIKKELEEEHKEELKKAWAEIPRIPLSELDKYNS